MIKIQKIHTGILGTNTYVVQSEDTCIVIDPADCSPELSGYLESTMPPSAILLTHGHFDHIGGAGILSEKYGAPIYVHLSDEEMLEDGVKNASFPLLYRSITVDAGSVKAIGESEFFIKDLKIKAYHTPGHSEGSLSYLIDGHLFSGDLVFEGGSYGRTDLHGGSCQKLISSIRSLASLPQGTAVHPGHAGDDFTLNEYFQYFGK